MMTRMRNAQAATYDLIIKGGRVIDPSVGLDGVRDVAIAGGRIVAIELLDASKHLAAGAQLPTAAE